MATVGTHQRRGGPRGDVTGWSPGAARRNVAFLRSVDERELTGHGYALTLTVRDCPASSTDWATIIDTWMKRQRRAGMIRLHWVMEYQRRGTPHLHVAIWYDNDAASGKAVIDWIEITQHLGTGPKGQDCRPLIGPVGWFMYLAKHCGRGAAHYQRQQKLLPAKWKKSPRVWSKSGAWVIIEPATGELTDRQYFRLRRLVRAQRVARARAAVPGPGWSWLKHLPIVPRHVARDLPIPAEVLGKAKTNLRVRLRHLVQARTMLRCTEQKLANVCGLSEWVPQSGQGELLRAI